MLGGGEVTLQEAWVQEAKTLQPPLQWAIHTPVTLTVSVVPSWLGIGNTGTCPLSGVMREHKSSHRQELAACPVFACN